MCTIVGFPSGPNQAHGVHFQKAARKLFAIWHIEANLASPSTGNMIRDRTETIRSKWHKQDPNPIETAILEGL